MPALDDYYEPFDYDYEHLKNAPEGSLPTARPRSLITGQRMTKIEKGPNWEDDLGASLANVLRIKTSPICKRDVWAV